MSRAPQTELQKAAEIGDLARVERLLESGAEVDAREPLTKARIPSMLAEEGEAAVLKAGFSLHRTPLMLAAGKGHFSVVERLLDAGAEKGEKDALGHTALTLACLKGRISVVRSLLTAGAKLKDRGPGKAPALHWAVESANRDLVHFLLESGADPNLKDARGRPALDLAATLGLLDLFELLLDADTDPTYQTRDGSTAVLSLVCSSSRVEIPKSEAFTGTYLSVQWTGNKVFAQVHLEEHSVLPVLEKLLTKGAPVESEGPYSPLSHAAMSGRPLLVKLLLEFGADPNRRSLTDGQTALDLARLMKRDEVVAMLEAVTQSRESSTIPPSSEADNWGPGLPLPNFRQAGKIRKFDKAVSDLARQIGAEISPFEQAPGALILTLAAQKDSTLLKEGLDHFRALGYLAFEPDGSTSEPQRLVCLPSSRWQDAVAVMGTNGVNFGIGPGTIVQWLEDLETRQPFELFTVTSDRLCGRFLTPIDNPNKLASEMAEFCPDLIEQGCGTVEELALSLSESDLLYFWWD